MERGTVEAVVVRTKPNKGGATGICTDLKTGHRMSEDEGRFKSRRIKPVTVKSALPKTGKGAVLT